MSRHRVTYKPGGAISRPLDLTLKMQRLAQELPAQPATASGAVACIPAPTGLFWKNASTGVFDQTAVTGSVENALGYYTPIPTFFWSARVEGELCGRDKDVVLAATWINSTFGDALYGPMIFTSGNVLVVYPDVQSLGLSSRVDPGIITVTALLDGVQIGMPITLTLTAAGGYY